jgi:AcrR family transcriptional regulator
MPRRLPHDHDEMRARAVAFARRLVASEGAAALTARRIAGELDCSVGSLYNLFVDLDDVVLHVAAAVIADLERALFAEALPDDSVAALVELALRYVRFARVEGRPWALIFEHEPGHDRPTPAWHLAAIDRLLGGVRAVAASAFGEGVEPADLARRVEVLWAAVHGVAALSQKDKLGFVTARDAEDLARACVHALVAGFARLP